jgi:hypothetical protein
MVPAALVLAIIEFPRNWKANHCQIISYKNEYRILNRFKIQQFIFNKEYSTIALDLYQIIHTLSIKIYLLKMVKIKTIKEFPRYEIYSDGRVYSKRSNKFMKITRYPYGNQVSFNHNSKKTHRKVDELVATAFLPNPKGYEIIRHIDNDIHNDDIDNLKWVSSSREKYSLPDKDGGATLLDCPDFIIYPDGEVYSFFKKDFIKFQKRGGYEYARLTSSDGKRPNISRHKIVSTFIPNPDKLIIPNHLDGDGYNNSSDNLEWTDSSGNSKHAHKTGLIKQYTRPVLQFTKNNEFVARYNSIKEAADAVGCQRTTIGQICRRKPGKHTAKGFKWVFETELEKFNIQEGEVWKEIPNHPKYKASTYGRIWSDKTNRCIKFAKRKDGYLRAYIDKKSYYVQQLIALTFYGPPPEELEVPVVDHINENKDDNRLENLEWVEFDENIRRAHKSGKNSTSRKCIQYDLDGNFVKKYSSMADAAREIGVSHTSIRNACHKITSVHTIKGFIWRFEDEPLLKEELKKIRSAKTSVCCYHAKTLKLIGTYKSMNEAGRDMEIDPSSISACCNQKVNLAGGYIWRYSTSPPPDKPVKNPGGKIAVDQFDMDDNFIKRWRCIAEAARELGIGGSHISSVCNGRRTSTGGFKWKRVE